jgi:serine/threonine-protein kinase SRPK3
MHHGANGEHFIMVFEILGVNLLEIMKRYEYKGVPMPLVRRMAKQILVGLDFLHRVCKIIHTDLKPENTIVVLSEESMGEIVKNGKIPKARKKYQPSKKLIIDNDCQLFIPNKKKQPSTLLEGQDTEGLSKLQKKKLKKKIKKELGVDEGGPEQETADQTNDGSVTMRELESKEPDSLTQRSKNTLTQLTLMNENEDDLKYQKPRSHSLPNLLYSEKDLDEEFDSDFEDS